MNENEFLKQRLYELYNIQVRHTQEMWTLINTIFDRKDDPPKIKEFKDD